MPLINSCNHKRVKYECKYYEYFNGKNFKNILKNTHKSFLDVVILFYCD